MGDRAQLSLYRDISEHCSHAGPAIAFDSRTKSLLIVNHAILSANPANFAVLPMFVGNPGNPLDKPILP